jgi:hypothetical protein
MPDTIRQGFIANLQAKANRTAIENQFLANLQRPDLSNPPELQAFTNACLDRSQSDPAGYVHDVERMLSVQRRLVRRLQIAESMTLLPGDDLAEPDLNLKLDPVTCRPVSPSGS